jgi:hypothetical protein
MKIKTLAAMMLLTSGLAQAKEPRPDWIDGSSMEYPREKYLIGVGLGDDRPSAEDRARGEIARTFSSVVTVNTSLSETEQNAQSAGKPVDSSFSQAVSQTVQTASKQALVGVDVVDNWEDAATHQHYALAVLEREKGAAVLKDKIAGFDKQAAAWKSQLDAATEKLSRVKAAMKLLALFKARASLNAELRVLDLGSKGLENPLDEAAVRPQAAKAVAALDVAVDVSGTSSEQIETGILQGLSGFGIEAKSTTNAADSLDIAVSARVDTKPMDGTDPRWKWARSTVTISLKDAKAGKTFVQFDATDRESSSDYDEAVRRSQVALAQKAAAKINAAITEYFENQ